MKNSYKQMPHALYQSIFTLFIVSTLFFAGCSDNPTGGISGTGRTAPTLNTGIIVEQVSSTNQLPIILNTGIIVGQIDSTNQFSIDGLALDAAQAQISINGETAQLEALRTGMSVVAQVDYQQNTATSISYQPLLSGPITTTSDDKSIIEVLGQKINVTSETYLDSLTVEDIYQDNIIEVSGGRDANGNIVADYIRTPDLEESFYVVGQLEPDSTQSLLVVGTSIDSQSLTTAVSNRDLIPGATIKAELMNPEPDSLPGTPFVATGASIVTQPTPTQFETVSVKGMVTEIDSDGNFRIKNFVFWVNSETTFLDSEGTTTEPFSIQENQKLKLAGYAIGDNRVLATSVTRVEGTQRHHRNGE